MKKIISLMIAVAMVFCFALPALAEEAPDEVLLLSKNIQVYHTGVNEISFDLEKSEISVTNDSINTHEVSDASGEFYYDWANVAIFGTKGTDQFRFEVMNVSKVARPIEQVRVNWAALSKAGVELNSGKDNFYGLSYFKPQVKSHTVSGYYKVKTVTEAWDEGGYGYRTDTFIHPDKR